MVSYNYRSIWIMLNVDTRMKKTEWSNTQKNKQRKDVKNRKLHNNQIPNSNKETKAKAK